jgi:hypothetical protein
MNFREFQTHRAKLLATNRSLIDLAETNIAKAFSDVVPRLSEVPGRHIHRCDLAKSWLGIYGLPGTLSRQALISCGVRHSLSLLFSALAKDRLTLLIPEDVYPTYAELARAAGVHYSTFPTIPEMTLPDDGDWLLLPNPLKPLGRWLTTEEVSSLYSWLKVDPRRRLVLDAVYNFELSLHPTTQTLFASGQTIVLQSLSKAWLHPKVLGIALVPILDVDVLLPLFRDNSPPQINLSAARCLFDDYHDMPATIAARIAGLWPRFLERIPEQIASRYSSPAIPKETGYFVVLHADPAQIREQHRLLTLPLTVFGSRHTDYCVASTL